ncbi:flagella synthesis protein FlgN [Chitinimonas lacunae]|uniref:Flagella synthesis protein FlgN n=1 Tax=Chitinimonas lacunae TaxID=1963018 RepID=A0ABV8MQA5_9NEIS
MESLLSQAFAAELIELDRFIAVLEREQAALIANDLADLIEIAKQKAERAQTLEMLARERKRLFDLNGVAIDDNVPHEMLAVTRLPAADFPALAAQWRDLLQKARHASALNQTNGQLINTRQQQNQQMIALFQNERAGNLSYDAYGQPRLSSSGHSLGKA